MFSFPLLTAPECRQDLLRGAGAPWCWSLPRQLPMAKPGGAIWAPGCAASLAAGGPARPVCAHVRRQSGLGAGALVPSAPRRLGSGTCCYPCVSYNPPHLVYVRFQVICLPTETRFPLTLFSLWKCNSYPVKFVFLLTWKHRPPSHESCWLRGRKSYVM